MFLYVFVFFEFACRFLYDASITNIKFRFFIDFHCLSSAGRLALVAAAVVFGWLLLPASQTIAMTRLHAARAVRAQHPLGASYGAQNKTMFKILNYFHSVFLHGLNG